MIALLAIGGMVALFGYLFGAAGPFVLAGLIVGYLLYLLPGMRDGLEARDAAASEAAPSPWRYERRRDRRARRRYLGSSFGAAARRSANLYWSRKLFKQRGRTS